MEMNFIKVIDERTKDTVGFAVVEKGSREETMIVERFIDEGIIFVASNEEEFVNFEGDFVKRFGNGMFCTHAPMAD
jgi:hypothetical protein